MGGPQLELRLRRRIPTEKRHPPPDRHGAGELLEPLVEVGEVAERADVVGGLLEHERQLGAGISGAAEALFEDGRATQTDGAKCFPGSGELCEPRGAALEMHGETRVVAERTDERLERVIGLLVVRVVKGHPAPDLFGLLELVARLERSREALEENDPVRSGR